MSKDRGASWQKISEAKPQVKAFNYQAEGDGEYWFAIRTLDRNGQPQPAGPYQPELRVIVDTTMPRIESFAAQYRGDGACKSKCRAMPTRISTRLRGSSKSQLDASDTWQPLAGLAITPPTAMAVLAAAGRHCAAGAIRPRHRLRSAPATRPPYGAAITGTPYQQTV